MARVALPGTLKFARSIKNFGKTFVGDARDFGKDVFSLTADTSKATGRAAKVGGSLLDGLLGLFGSVINAATWLMDKFRGVFMLGAVAAGGFAIKGHFDGKRAEALRTRELQNTFGQGQQGSPYMNSVNPQETALLDARMRQSAPGQPGFADKLLEQQQQVAGEAAKS